MSEFEDNYNCPKCEQPIDLEKTRIDILLKKFDINEALIKADKKIQRLESQLQIEREIFGTKAKDLNLEIVTLESQLEVAVKELKRSRRKKLHFLGDISGTSYGWIRYTGHNKALKKIEELEEEK